MVKNPKWKTDRIKKELDTFISSYKGHKDLADKYKYSAEMIDTSTSRAYRWKPFPQKQAIPFPFGWIVWAMLTNALILILPKIPKLQWPMAKVANRFPKRNLLSLTNIKKQCHFIDTAFFYFTVSNHRLGVGVLTKSWLRHHCLVGVRHKPAHQDAASTSGASYFLKPVYSLRNPSRCRGQSRRKRRVFFVNSINSFNTCCASSCV